MSHAFHTARANILINLIDALIGLNGNRAMWTGGRTGCALNTRLEFRCLMFEVVA